jgi:sodium/proline symporter
MTRAGAYAGLLVGGATVIVWMQLKDLGGVFALYEIVPGMLFSALAIVAVSLAQRR